MSLQIKIPKNICDCDHNCICKQFIKCRNNCFCGNVLFNTQAKSLHSALTPDYKFKKLKRTDSKVLFGDTIIIKIKKAEYHSPRYFKMLDINNRFRNGNLTPQFVKSCNERVRTPGSA